MKLSKRVEIKVFAPGNKQFRTIRQVAPTGKGYTSEGIDQMLEHIAAQVETAYPAEEYRLVSIGSARFNFVHAGPRAEQEQETREAIESATIGA